MWRNTDHLHDLKAIERAMELAIAEEQTRKILNVCVKEQNQQIARAGSL